MERIRDHLMYELVASHRQVTDLLLSVAHDQDWQPGVDAWSFRYVAAHLATTEYECFWERVKRVTAEEKPHFANYLNTGRDFSQFNLRDSLQSWELVRQHLLQFVDNLPPENLRRTAIHEKQGEVTLVDLLQMMLDHDLKHMQELKSWQGAHTADCCRREVESLHRFFQDWFNGDIPATEVNLARLTAALADNFTLIGPDGNSTTRQPLLDWISTAHNSRQGFKIWTERYQPRLISGDTALVTYQEWQQPQQGNETTTRISTALFKRKPDAPNGVQWLHVHETWLAQ